MKCKFCNEELPERGNFCPFCGGDNSDRGEREEYIVDPQEIAGQLQAIEVEYGEMIEYVSDGEDETVDAENEEVEEIEEDEEDVPFEPSPQLKRARFISSMTGCVAALALLAVVLFAGISGNFSEDGQGWDVSKLFSWVIPRANDVLNKDSYTVDGKKAMKKRETVVATIPGAELTNGQLQVYYWTQVYDFLNNNSYYLSYLGLDYTSPLDKQSDYYRTGTWQQYFLEGALEKWHSNVAFAMLAKKNGFQLDPVYQEQLDSLRQDMEEDALKGGYASAEEMLQESMGPGCTMDDYIAYMEVYYLGYCYFAELYGALDPTMEEIEAYFEENKATFESEKITKDSGYTVDIRHILIKIEELKTEEGDAETQTEEETTEEELIDGYTQAAWDACLAKANEILDRWLAGEKTEDSFGELAKQHSADGNASEGGIYTGVAQGDMVESFDEWCFDVVRQEGDYGIVRTKYGYHIMYFVSKEDIWITQSRAKILEDAARKMVSDALEAYPMEVTYKKIVLGEVDLG